MKSLLYYNHIIIPKAFGKKRRMNKRQYDNSSFGSIISLLMQMVHYLLLLLDL